MQSNGPNGIVTGGATGIGRAIGLKLAGQGVSVLVADINAEAAEATASDIAALGVESGFVATDVTNREATDRMVEAAFDTLGGVDILINNAGVAGAPGWDSRQESTEEDWHFTFRVNVKGIVNCTESAKPAMIEAKAGKIVNVASIAGREGRPSLPHYSASKSAVINYTQSLANELAQHNVNVNAVCPGLLWTPMWEQVAGRYGADDPQFADLAPKEIFDSMVQANILLGRPQTPEDIGEAVAFLVSEDARNITGQSLNVDGGFFLR